MRIACCFLNIFDFVFAVATKQVPHITRNKTRMKNDPNTCKKTSFSFFPFQMTIFCSAPNCISCPRAGGNWAMFEQFLQIFIFFVFHSFSRWFFPGVKMISGWLQMCFRRGFETRSCRERRLGVLESFARDLGGWPPFHFSGWRRICS